MSTGRFTRMTRFDGQTSLNEWLVTFGDLLTLLLCFFLGLIALSPVNPANQRPENDISSLPDGGNFEAAGDPENLFTRGTTFAHSFDGISYRSVPISEIVFNRTAAIGESGGTDEVREAVIKAVSFDGYQVEEVLVETCASESVEVGDEARWFTSVQRALMVQSQLLDVGVEASKIKVRVLGPWCSVLIAGIANANPDSPLEEPAGLLKLKMRST